MSGARVLACFTPGGDILHGMLRLFVLILALCLIPSASRADDIELRVSPYLLVGGGGDVKFNSTAVSDAGSWGAGASVGFGTRFEAAITQYISIGGLFEFASLGLDGVRIFGFALTPDRAKIMDFDVWVKGGTRFDLGPGELEVYGGIPFGLTVGITSFNDERETNPGYNLGLLGGAQYWFDRFGVFTELGYRFHKIIDGGEVRQSSRLSQIVWHLGGSIAF